MRIAIVYDAPPIEAALRFGLQRTSLIVTENTSTADVVVSDSHEVLSRALERDQLAVQYIVGRTSMPHEDLSKRPELKDRFRVVESRHGLPNVPLLVDAILELASAA